MDPALVPPNGKWLAGQNPEEILSGVAALRRQFRANEPGFGKLFRRVGHIFAAENPKLQHLPGRKVGLEFRVEITPGRLRQPVTITALHLVVYKHGFHESPQCALRVGLQNAWPAISDPSRKP